ncbi:cilia- and flagella-associated protein 46 [Rhinophrynus dorsalis]
MDLIIRHHLSAAENHQDAQALLNAYKLMKADNTDRSTADVPENFSPDLYVLCAEQALQFGNPAVSKDCLQMYFKTKPPPNQFYGRAYLCKAQLYKPQSTKNVDELEKSVVYYLKAINFGKEQSRYHFLVFNASVLYWQMARPFLKPGSRYLLIPSLTSVVKALEEIDELDHVWRAELMMELIECMLDAQKIKEATEFALVASDYIKMNVPQKYPQLFSKMVHHKLIDSTKTAKETRRSVTLSVIQKIQKLNSLQMDTITTKDIFTNLNDIYKLLTTLEDKNLSNASNSEKTSLLIELTHLSLEFKCNQIATSCINDLKKTDITEPETLIVLECLQCELEVLNIGNKISLYTKGVVEAQLKVIRRLESTLQDAIRVADPNAIQLVCTTLWNLCLPLLQHNLRSQLRKPLLSISESLEEIDSLLTTLRCQIHLEVAQIEESEDRIEIAIKHIQKALHFDDNGQYEHFLMAHLHRLQLRAMLYKKPDRLEDQAAMIIEQAKQTNSKDSVRKKRSLLVNAGLCLAPDVFQMVLDSENDAKVSTGKRNKGQVFYLCMKAQHHTKCVQKTEGHLQRMEDKNASERVRLWAELAKAARKKEVWDVCRTACRFCLLYDDGRWTVPKNYIAQKKKSTSNGLDEEKHLASELEASKPKTTLYNDEKALLRTLAEIRFINAEATIHLLKSEGCKLNDSPKPPEDTNLHPMGYISTNPEDHPDWIVYRNWIFELSKYATDNFLQAAELGVELHEAWITHNAAVYILNHNRHLIAAGRLPELTETFQKLLTALKKTGHNGNAVLLLVLSNALAKGLILRWIPAFVQSPELSLHSGKGKKAPGKGSEKHNLSHVLSVDPNGLPDVKLALEVCEYALDLTKGHVPEDVVPISVRQQILSTWVKAKQLHQQQIGTKLGTDDEENTEGQNPITRVLVAIEMHSCNGLGLMDFTVPSLSQVYKMCSECIWSDSLVEIQTLTRLAHFAYNAHELELAMNCTQKVLKFNEKTKKHEICSSSLEREMLSIAACIQGQCIMANLSGNKHLRLSAIQAFHLSGRFAGEADSLPLTLQAAKHFWNACFPLLTSAKEREPLKEATISVLNALTVAESKQKQVSENDFSYLHLWPSSDVQSHGVEYSEFSKDMAEDDDSSDHMNKLRASLYELLFNMYADKNDWESGLKVLDEAIQILPRTKHRLVLFKHRLLVKARLGHNFFMDIQKFKDENEDYLSYIWHHVTLTSLNTSEQLACYQNAIDVLKKPEHEWQKVDYLLELVEWLYCKQYPVSHALHQLDWAVDILLQMKFSSNVEEDKGHKGKTKPKRNSSMAKEQRHSENVNEDMTKTENGKHNSSSCKSLEDLRNVRQLEALVRAYTLMAIISGHSSPYHEQYCLMAYTYIMRIWQVSLPAAGSFIRALPKLPPSIQNPQSASSRKEKGKKEPTEPVVTKEKSKRKGPVDVLPVSYEEWAAYDCPDEVREAFKQDVSCQLINRNTIVKPTYTLSYLDLLIKELHSISLTHLTLPVLQLAEVIAHDAIQCNSLSDLYHLKISQVCADLKLYSAAAYHEKVVGNVFISENEQISCRQEIQLHKEKNQDRSHMEPDNKHQLWSRKEKILELNCEGKGINALSLPYLWLQKADILIQLGYFQPARLLLFEAHKSFQEMGDKYDQLKCMYLLSVLANNEKNHGQAKALLIEAQPIEKDAEFWYKTTIALSEAVIGENKDGKEEKACKILETTLTSLQTMVPNQANRESEYGFYIASLHARKLSLITQTAKNLINTGCALSQITVMLLEICDKMSQIESDLLQYGYKEYRAELMMEHSNVFRLLASIAQDEERKHSYYLDAYSMAERAISIQEQVQFNIQSLFPLHEAGGISLPVMRKLANLKLSFAELALEIIQLISIEEIRKFQEEKRKGRLCVVVEEFVRSTPDYNTIEQEWKMLGRTVGNKTLCQLASVSTLIFGCADLKAKCFHLTGKCLHLLSVKVDPLGPDMYWNENFVDERKYDTEKEDYNDSAWTNDDSNLTNKQVQLAKKAMELKKNRKVAQVYLAQASEILLQSIHVAINNNLLSTLSAASLQICLCLGQFDPISSGLFLALYQSCSTCLMVNNVVCAASCNTSNSQFAALLHLHQYLQEKGDSKSRLLRSIEHRLSSTSKVWENLNINLQFFNIINELPVNFNVVVLQHSEDRSSLFGAVLEKPKVVSLQKGKLNQPQQKSMQAKIVRCTVDSQKLSNLLAKMELFKQDMMQSLFKKESQRSLNRPKNVSEKIQELSKNKEMNTWNNSEDENEKKLSTTFHEIIDDLEAYLSPVLRKLDFTTFRYPTPLIPATESVRAKSRDKEEKPATASSPLADTGDCIILLADKLLMELPLEALPMLAGDGISSVSRDFSLQFLYNRIHREQTAEGEVKRDEKSSKGPRQKAEQKKNIKTTPINRILPPNCISVENNHIKYIVDPFNEAQDQDAFSPGLKMNEILGKYSQQFTSHWEGIIGSSHIPSHAEWENLMTSCSAFLFYGTERFSAHILLDKFIAMNFTECQLMILLDLVRTKHSFARQSTIDVQKSETNLVLERPVETALLLSVAGVRSVMLNQWHTTLEQNAKRLDCLSESLLALGKTTGQTIHNQRKAGGDVIAMKGEEEHEVEVHGSSCVATLPALDPSFFSYVLYGLPNLVVM